MYDNLLGEKFIFVNTDFGFLMTRNDSTVKFSTEIGKLAWKRSKELVENRDLLWELDRLIVGLKNNPD